VSLSASSFVVVIAPVAVTADPIISMLMAL
jgi:hypothetical protein